MPTTELALVTGGGRGYGRVAALRLAAAGFQVAVLGRDACAVSAVAAEVGGISLVADVLDRGRVRSEVEALVEANGPIDVLINNAGVGGAFALAWEADDEDWWRTFEVNVRGTHIVTSAVLPAMVERGRGRVINIVSHAGTARWPYGSAYAVSKAAAIKYGENLAAELRRRGVVVLNFHPGLMEIGLTETLFASKPEEGSVNRLVADWFEGEIAAGRAIDAEVSVALLVRLASGEADAFSGRYLTAYDDLDQLLAESGEILSGDAYTLGLLKP